MLFNRVRYVNNIFTYVINRARERKFNLHEYVINYVNMN